MKLVGWCSILHVEACKARVALVVPLWKLAAFWPLLCPDGRHLAPFFMPGNHFQFLMNMRNVDLWVLLCVPMRNMDLWVQSICVPMWNVDLWVQCVCSYVGRGLVGPMSVHLYNVEHDLIAIGCCILPSYT